ncbi:MAG: hypothetical protein JWO68_1821 [Actinomycetia bacterium]|nr:hypothetical protein [Actinomycetes bacterium]
MIEAPAAAPPTPPGAFGRAASPREVLGYLGVLTRWRDQLHATLEGLDARGRAATDPDAFVADVTLAFALWQSIATRVDAVVATWDSGRVTDVELEEISELLWGRLDQNLDAALAVTFTEACTLLDALVRRLATRLETDALARTGVGDVLGPLDEQLRRCQALADGLGERGDEVRALRARLDRATAAGRAGTDVREELAAIAAAVAPVDRDLTVADAAERSITNDTTSFADRLERAGQAEADVRVLARRCAEKIAGAPRLAVPAVAVLGPVPTGGGRTERRAALDAFGTRLQQLERALAEAHRRYAAPLDERAELRGLLDAYRQMAAHQGRAEDADLAAHHAAARACLWSAPCDLVEGRRLVEAYRREVHRTLEEP